MKNYRYTWQWGNNPGYTINICVNQGYLALPLGITWWSAGKLPYNRCFSIGVDFLCFHFSIEIWKWRK